MDFNFGYDTYQDVRRNLFFYSIPVLITAGFLTFFFVLPPSTQQVVVRFLEYASKTQPLQGVLGTGVGLVVFSAIAFLLTEIIQVHDQWYDRYIIKWRHRYATQFIMPRLLQPWLSRTNYRIFESADTYVRQFQERLYYPFVGDRDLKIPKNKLVRFYEVITVYWLTQINEIVLLVITALIFFFRYRGPINSSYRALLFNDLLILIVLFLINRVWVRMSLSKVQRATEEEISAILENPESKVALKIRFREICKDYSIPYGEADKD